MKRKSGHYFVEVKSKGGRIYICKGKQSNLERAVGTVRNFTRRQIQLEIERECKKT